MSRNLVDAIVENSQKILRGKSDRVKLVLCNFLAGGHTLIEDVPGVGKTTLIKFMSKSLGLNLSRVQFTNDLLPADILGTRVFDKTSGEFYFHKGPIFGQIILADELNRAPAKTQSALLQAMEEAIVSIESETHELPEHFTVMATQNPKMQLGTFGLPESQLDRFSMKIDMGYPDKKSSIEIFKDSFVELIDSVEPMVKIEDIIKMKEEVKEVHMEDSLYELIYQLIDTSRNKKDLLPLSNRSGVDLVKCSKAWAYIAGRDYVLPDDIHYIFPFVVGHRLIHPESSQVNLERKRAKELLDLI